MAGQWKRGRFDAIPRCYSGLRKYRLALLGRFHLIWLFQKVGRQSGNMEPQIWEREVPRYFQNLRRLKPTYCFVPLYDDVFNRCKSGIAWLEGTYAGAVCLASALPEFQHAHQFTTSIDLSNLLDLIDENGIDLSENYLNSVSGNSTKLLTFKCQSPTGGGFG